eukprot:54927_1
MSFYLFVAVGFILIKNISAWEDYRTPPKYVEKPSEPEYVEPEYVEPEYVEPSDPVYVEPEYTEPDYVEPSDPDYVEPEYVDPEYVDPDARPRCQTCSRAAINTLIAQALQSFQCLFIMDSDERFSVCGNDGNRFWVDFWFENGDRNLFFASTNENIDPGWESLDQFLSLGATGYRTINAAIVDEFDSWIYVPGITDITFTGENSATAILGSTDNRERILEVATDKFVLDTRQRYVFREYRFKRTKDGKWKISFFKAQFSTSRSQQIPIVD